MPCQSGYKFPGIQYQKIDPIGDVLTTPRAISGFIVKDNADDLDLSTISANRFSAAAIKTDGTLWVWGSGDGGMLGTNSIVAQSSPVQTISGGTNWKHVSATGGQTQQHMAAIKTDGTLWLWGCNASGGLGNDSIANQSSPVQTISGGTDWKQVSTGWAQTAAIKTDGTLWLWGCNGNGQLGNNARSNRSSPVQTVSGGTNWKNVSVGASNLGAVKTDGTLWMWGLGTSGKLGNNSSVDISSPVQTISGGTDWKTVTAAGNSVGAIKCDGTLWMWGSNSFGILGTNDQILRSSPVQTVSGGTNWKQISMDPVGSTPAAIKTDGSLWVWGAGCCGHFGNDLESNFNIYSSPVQALSGRTGWCQVMSSRWRMFATDLNGQLYSWGENGNGILGQNQVFNDTGIRCRSSDFDDVFVRKEFFSEGGLWVWGFASLLPLNLYVSRSSPVQTVSGGTNWKQVSVGNQGAGIKADGTLWLWGPNSDGPLGNNSITDRSSPVQTVSGGTNWKQVAAGDCFTAAIKTDGTLWVWGKNNSGMVGDNTVISKSSPVQTVSGGTNWKQVNAKNFTLAAIKTDGTLWAWGLGQFGALGNNSIASQSSPVQTVSGGTDWKQVSAGQCNVAAIKTDGTLWLWGNNTCGAIGDDSIIDKSSPVQTVSGGTNWKQVSIYRHTAAIKTDGTLWLWGSNSLNAQLGTNNRTNRSSPVQTVSGGTNWRLVTAGHSSTVAIKTDGTLWLWGSDSNGLLGKNTRSVDASSPVQTVSGGTNWKDVSVASGVLTIREDCW